MVYFLYTFKSELAKGLPQVMVIIDHWQYLKWMDY